MSEVPKFRVNSLSIIYYCAIQNLLAFLQTILSQSFKAGWYSTVKTGIIRPHAKTSRIPCLGLEGEQGKHCLPALR